MLNCHSAGGDYLPCNRAAMQAEMTVATILAMGSGKADRKKPPSLEGGYYYGSLVSSSELEVGVTECAIF